MKRLLVAVLLLLCAAVACAAESGSATLEARLDAIVAETYKPNEPGAAVLVIKDGKTLLRKGYGLADMELDVPVVPDNIFRIGSVAKQFTAVAVLQLVQQGKIALGDDITKYLPDAPVSGKKITIEHLLTHTSGIPSYTDQPAFLQRAREDLKPEEMLKMAAGVPHSFEPGSQWHYNNSGYILLGMLIEKVGGMPYAEFMRRNVFEPAGLRDTAYDDTEKVIPRRAHGYSRHRGGWVNAPYLSMTIPFSAGALISTVDDLAKWNEALRGGKLVDPKLLARAQTGYTLTSGAATRYGYGWAVSTWEGHRVVEHGGGIQGFLSSLLTLPDDNLVVVILSNANRPRSPQYTAYRIAGEVIGKPFPPKTTAIAPETLDRYAGAYRLDEKRVARVLREGDRLLLSIPDGPTVELLPLSATEFAMKDFVGRVHLDGAKLTIDGVGPVERGTRTTETERKEVKAEPASYKRFEGRYELAPTFSIVVTSEGEHLYGQATGQPRFEMFPESPTKFFLKVVDAQITFNVDLAGKVTGLVLHQNGRDMPGKKVE